MVENLGKWPSKQGLISKIRPSDGCKGDGVPLAVERWYDFHGFGWHLGTVGLACPLIYERETIMNAKIPEWVKPAVWGGIGGAVVIAIIGFSAGWVLTSGTADEQAERRAQQAVITALTPVCVAQFKKVPKEGQVTHLAALEKESNWQQGDYIEKQGWATMPGSKEPNDEVADACAEELLKAAMK